VQARAQVHHHQVADCDRDVRQRSEDDVLSLRVSGGKMATSIIFFAPAWFIGGFRDVFPYCEIDPVHKVIRYRSSADDEWRVYVPNTAEIVRAKASFARAGRAAQ
jgi:hypothetical protein